MLPWQNLASAAVVVLLGVLLPVNGNVPNCAQYVTYPKQQCTRAKRKETDECDCDATALFEPHRHRCRASGLNKGIGLESTERHTDCPRSWSNLGSCNTEYCIGATCTDQQVEDRSTCKQCSAGYEFGGNVQSAYSYNKEIIGNLCVNDNTDVNGGILFYNGVRHCPGGYADIGNHPTSQQMCSDKTLMAFLSWDQEWAGARTSLCKANTATRFNMTNANACVKIDGSTNPTNYGTTTTVPSATCTCQDEWGFNGATYNGCAIEPLNPESWCYTTAKCSTSNPSETKTGEHWSYCTLSTATTITTTGTEILTIKTTTTTATTTSITTTTTTVSSTTTTATSSTTTTTTATSSTTTAATAATTTTTTTTTPTAQEGATQSPTVATTNTDDGTDDWFDDDADDSGAVDDTPNPEDAPITDDGDGSPTTGNNSNADADGGGRSSNITSDQTTPNANAGGLSGDTAGNADADTTTTTPDASQSSVDDASKSGTSTAVVVVAAVASLIVMIGLAGGILFCRKKQSQQSQLPVLYNNATFDGIRAGGWQEGERGGGTADSAYRRGSIVVESQNQRFAVPVEAAPTDAHDYMVPVPRNPEYKYGGGAGGVGAVYAIPFETAAGGGAIYTVTNALRLDGDGYIYGGTVSMHGGALDMDGYVAGGEVPTRAGSSSAMGSSSVTYATPLSEPGTNARTRTIAIVANATYGDAAQTLTSAGEDSAA